MKLNTDFRIYYSLLDREKCLEKLKSTKTPPTTLVIDAPPDLRKHMLTLFNNQAFLEELLMINDILDLEAYLLLQIGDFVIRNRAITKSESKLLWLNQTIYICKDEYSKSSNEIHNQTISWCEENKKETLQIINSKKVKPEKSNKSKFLTLDVFFESISQYKIIMEIFVAKNIISPNTYIWKDDSKSNKSYLVFLIKYLHHQKYYKDNTCPSNKQIQEIAKNTFGKEIGIDTIKRTKNDSHIIDFIPPASTI